MARFGGQGAATLTQRITGTISALFRRDDLPAASARPKRRPKRRPTAARREAQSEEAFSRALRGLIAKQDTISAGGLQIIGMGRIRERLGDRWERYADRVHDTALRILKRRLDPTDVFSRQGDFGYVILFGALSEEEAQIKCSLIAEEIAYEVLGKESGSEDVEVKQVVIRLDGSVVAERVDLLSAVTRQLRKAYDAAESTGSDDTGAEPGRVAEEHRGSPAPSALAELGFCYRPVWHVYRQALLTVNCLPQRRNCRSTLDFGHAVLGMDPDHQEIAELDLLMLQRMIQDLMLLAQRGRLSLLAIQVHIKTLMGARSSRDFVALCQSIPEQLRDRVVFEVIELSKDVPQVSASRAIPRILPFCRTVIGQVPLGRTDFEDLLNTGIATVGIDLGRRRLSESRLFEAMERFAERAAEVGFGTFVHGLHSKSLATTAVCSGFRYLDGDGIRPAGSTAACVTHFKTPDLFRPLFLPPSDPGCEPVVAPAI